MGTHRPSLPNWPTGTQQSDEGTSQEFLARHLQMFADLFEKSVQVGR
jgi:hypothetical protein